MLNTSPNLDGSKVVVVERNEQIFVGRYQEFIGGSKSMTPRRLHDPAVP